MGFRRDSEHARNWSKWLAQHRSELVECGLPDFIYCDEARWGHFLGHGYDHESGWQPEMLSLVELQRLRAFVAREFPESDLSAELRVLSNDDE